MKMQDDNVLTFAMDPDQLRAYVYGHMGMTKNANTILKKLESYDRLAIGRYALLQFGSDLELSEEERADVIRQGEEYYEIWNAVGDQNYYEDK